MSYLGNTPTTQNFISGTDYFNGTGAQTAFTLSRTVASPNDIQVVVNNVVQQPNDAYTISGTTLTMTSAPSAGTNNVYVRYLSTTTQVITPSQNSVGTSQLAQLTTLPVVGGYTITLPAATGTAMVSGNMPAFSAYMGNSSQSVTSNVDTKIRFDSEEYDTANCFDSTTNYRFTPNVAGYYQFSLSTSFSGSSVTNNEIAFYKNGTYYKRGAWNTAGQQITASVLIYLNGSTDYVEFYGLISATSPQIYTNGTAKYTWVTGYLARTA